MFQSTEKVIFKSDITITILHILTLERTDMLFIHAGKTINNIDLIHLTTYIVKQVDIFDRCKRSELPPLAKFPPVTL